MTTIYLTMTATNNTTGRKETYAELDISEETTNNDILNFVEDLIGSTARDYIKLTFTAYDEASLTLGVPVRIPTMPNSDNCGSPIQTIMCENNIDDLFGIIVEDLIRSVGSIAHENECQGYEAEARTFYKLRDTLVEAVA